MITDTIVALATPSGVGAIGIIRLSGENSIELCNKAFNSTNRKKDLCEQKSHTLHFGTINDGDRIIDEVLVSIFKGTNSYTGENSVEVSCHGSQYILQEVINLFIRLGARMAQPGEFTLRAFTNGKLDLSQAEAVADLIHSESEAAHKTAMQQMRGGFSKEIEQLRDELIHFASMIELELDFAEEDVEFADRGALELLVERIKKVIKRLVDSFAVGNVIKNGIPVAIVGEPNVGKSTLLNVLLNEERAIVSEIAGTTRDTIEDELNIGGQIFRFIDTAGIRETTDTIESLGIKKTFEKIDQASIVIYLFDSSKPHKREIEEIEKISKRVGDKKLIILANKIDLADIKVIEKEFESHENLFCISAKFNEGVEKLTDRLLSYTSTGQVSDNQNIVTNSRHYEALLLAYSELTKVEEGLAINLSGDFLAIDIRQALYHLGEITGQVTSDDLLGNILSNFCIGK